MGAPAAPRKALLLLLLALTVSFSLRVWELEAIPPGLHPDEAANAWNAWSVLQTGKDWTGRSWPLFYSRAYGENRSPIYYYALLPFQAALGMSVYSTRLPAALGGVVTVLLLYLIGSRLFGPTCGVLAAWLIALNPWHVWLSRLGLEASLTPLLIALSLWLYLRAGLPFTDGEPAEPRPFAAGLAGFVAGASCYGYWSTRLFLPAFTVVCVLAAPRAWLRVFRSRRGGLAVGAFLLGWALTIGPLGWRHVSDAEISKRGVQTRVWTANDPLAVRLGKVLSRYPPHFGHDFLFERGDPFPLHTLPGTGPFPLYALPLVVSGALALALTCRSSRATRMLLVWLAVYPFGDCLAAHEGVHALRSTPGIGALVLLAALGGARGGAWLRRRSLATFVVALFLLAAAASLSARSFVLNYYRGYGQRPEIRQAYQADLLDACESFRNEILQADATFFTVQGTTEPFAITLFGLRYSPEQWFRDDRELRSAGTWDIYSSYGKIHFMYPGSFESVLEVLRGNRRRDHVLFVVRPGEIRLGHRLGQIRGPDGKVTLQILDIEL